MGIAKRHAVILAENHYRKYHKNDLVVPIRVRDQFVDLLRYVLLLEAILLECRVTQTRTVN
jgi:hypothetical protein